MPSKRPFHIEEIDQFQSKKFKMLKDIEECMKNKPIVKLINIHDKVNQKKLLFEAIESHDVKSLEELLKIKVDFNMQDEEGCTPLLLAVDFGHFEIVKILVSNRANLNATNFYDETPLGRAIEKGHYTITKYLLENGASVNVDFGNESPLQIAIKEQNLEIIQMLLENGANPNFYDNSEDTVPAMDQALEIGNSVIIKMLLKYGADGNTFLSQAIISKNNLAMVELLLKNNVNVNICDYYGMPHLHFAITETINIEIIYLLIRFGADINAPDADSHNPLHYAIQFRKEDFQLLELLMQNGANPNLKDKQDTSTIEYALYKKNTKYFKAIFYNQCYL